MRRAYGIRRIIAFLIGVAVVAAVLPARAQQVQRIAAIVNDEVVSVYDLVSRLRLVIVSAGLQDTPEVRRRLAPEVLRTLIDERLQMQEAKRRNVSVSKRDMDRAVAVIEKQNRISAGGLGTFMRQGGVDPRTMLDQVRANIAWTKLVQRRLRPRVNVGDEEVQEVLDRLKAGQGQDEFRLSDILISFDSPDDEGEARQTAERLVGQIRQGARFEALARQFSHSATAAVGGDLGWVRGPELDPKVLQVVSALSKGQSSAPVRTISGYHIYKMVDRRKIAAKGQGEAVLRLKQVFLPLAGDASAEAARNQIDLAKTVAGTVQGCPDMDVIAKEVRSPRPATLGKIAYSNLSGDIRNAIDGLPVGQPSKPVRVPDGVMVLMVCERIEPEFQLPSRAEVADQLARRRLEQMSRRYLRDIRRAAVVDVRV